MKKLYYKNSNIVVGKDVKIFNNVRNKQCNRF